MTESRYEGRVSRIENADFLAKIREDFASTLEELVTNPKPGGSFDTSLPGKIRADEKIGGGRDVEGILVRIGQDYRLSPDEIDALKERWLE